MRSIAAWRIGRFDGTAMTSSPFTRRFWVQFSRWRLMTRSPGFTCETPAPTAVTRPTHSAPGVAGSGGFRR